MSQIHDHNRRAWDARARNAGVFARPVGDDDFRAALAATDRSGWLGSDLRGKRILCLAAGGGKAGPLFAAAGAEVTVVDISPEMLALDRRVAEERGVPLRVVEASMDDLSALPEAHYDIVSQPVSTCYLPDVEVVYRQVARVIVAGGMYISQHKQPASLQADTAPSPRGYELVEPYQRRGPLPNVEGSRHRESGTMEFLHTWEQLVGGLCRSGFVIEDLEEPQHAEPESALGTFGHRSVYVPPYVRIKAHRRQTGQASARVWTP